MPAMIHATANYEQKMITVEKTAELTGHSNPIFTLELSQKPGILFTGGNDKGLVEWSLKDNAFIKVMFPVAASVYAGVNVSLRGWLSRYYLPDCVMEMF